MNDGTAYFAVAVSYRCKIFMKLATGVNAIKLFPSLKNRKKVRVVLLGKPFQPGRILEDKFRGLPFREFGRLQPYLHVLDLAVKT
jgi:hypothetical protein